MNIAKHINHHIRRHPSRQRQANRSGGTARVARKQPQHSAANAAAIRAQSYMSIGMLAASGVLEGIQIAGKKATGGPVSGGATYLVGERGPELFTPGASGVVTPNDKLGGKVEINQTFSITGVGAELTQNMKTIAKQAAEESKAFILNSMNRGGTFALASGRMR